MSILQKLTEGVVSRDMRKEGAALLNKWEQTGLLEGLGNDVDKNNMARLLENQAKQLLKEAASSMGGGDVEGFAAVAFPIVRRVFGGLIANDLVSVQPMSLPSGLIFFLDFTFGGFGDNVDPRGGYAEGSSLYGGDAVAAQLTGGVDLSGVELGGQFYNLSNGYSSPTGTIPNANRSVSISGSLDADGKFVRGGSAVNHGANYDFTDDQINSELLKFDANLTSGSAFYVVDVAAAGIPNFNYDNLAAVALITASGHTKADAPGLLPTGMTLHRRLSSLSASAGAARPERQGAIRLLVTSTGSTTAVVTQIKGDLAGAGSTYSYPRADDFQNASGKIGAVVGDSSNAAAFGLEDTDDIPEINLKVDSISVTAVTKKLKAKWTPELGQDLNAYHNLDAEVELTSILSEQIALEIDREIVEDLVKGSSAATYYWSRSPGLFLNKETGAEIGASSAAPDFTGTVSEWYETLGETINDVSAQIHRKTLRGGANFLVTSPEVANILEFTAGFRANVTHDDATGTAGTHQVGTLSKRYDVYVDPYFPRNLILVGRKGGSFLESGYVYAPYVPLQVTPTIFGVEDFVPRKGVMTRYAKKMVRPDMYGLVICRGLLGESGGS